MEKVRELRARARLCRVNALRAVSDGVRDHYAELARMWDKLADERLLFFAEQPDASPARVARTAPAADEGAEQRRCTSSDE